VPKSFIRLGLGDHMIDTRSKASQTTLKNKNLTWNSRSIYLKKQAKTFNIKKTYLSS